MVNSDIIEGYYVVDFNKDDIFWVFEIYTMASTYDLQDIIKEWLLSKFSVISAFEMKHPL